MMLLSFNCTLLFFVWFQQRLIKQYTNRINSYLLLTPHLTFHYSGDARHVYWLKKYQVPFILMDDTDQFNYGINEDTVSADENQS